MEKLWQTVKRLDEQKQNRKINKIVVPLLNIPTIEEIIIAQRADTTRKISNSYSCDSELGIILYNGVISLPYCLRLKIINGYHATVQFMHYGVSKTSSLILKSFNWPNLHIDVADYVSICLKIRKRLKLLFIIAIKTILLSYRVMPNTTNSCSLAFIVYGLDPQVAPDIDSRVA